ncbi:hypothetical protein [Dactylosporangium sp. NPDC049140]|uniref:hypothetical protein n=1 Tax=Dactylosporangium sp. NPDC049140 TaxID=3155647 RepID=UPI0033E270E1
MSVILAARRARAGRAGCSPDDVSAALAHAAAAAREAPSVVATQPCRWWIGPDGAHLDADRGGRPGRDPDDRLLTISCGAALHYATVALAADGVGVKVVRLPSLVLPGRIAVLRYTGPAEPDPRAQRLRQAIGRRSRDRRPVGAEPVPGAQLRLLRRAAAAAGASLYPLPAQATDRTGLAVIATVGVGPRDWLATGEAMSAVLLSAAAEGLATGPVTALSARVPTALTRLLPPGAGHPAAVVRFGVADR